MKIMPVVQAQSGKQTTLNMTNRVIFELQVYRSLLANNVVEPDTHISGLLVQAITYLQDVSTTQP